MSDRQKDLARHRRYNRSEKGRERGRRYNSSEKGYARQAKYEASRIRIRLAGGLLDTSYRVPPGRKEEFIKRRESFLAAQRREYSTWNEALCDQEERAK